MERWDNQIEPFKKYLHIPVDSYIMEAASKMLDIKIIDKQGQYNLYKIGVSKPWSKWGYNDYIKFQEDIRNAVKGCPMDWEFEAWNETKNRRKSK